MALLFVALMLAAGVAAIVVAAQGTQGQLYQAITGSKAPGFVGSAGGSGGGPLPTPWGGTLIPTLPFLPHGGITGIPFSPLSAPVHPAVTGGGTLL